ncbi:unnamed protein product [Callosobruchus maculatus]|uniref:Uncharacterized protein n=1 Tax=Callosobruchus maculatus TaxID=64391 RepID=A0A653DHU8_CALMS|nr:unnamed protein product [Callosobruchus maculatus]
MFVPIKLGIVEKVGRFNHSEKKCYNQKVCSKCGQNHDSTSCIAVKHTCCNCSYSNNKYHKNYDTNHSPTEKTCPLSFSDSFSFQLMPLTSDNKNTKDFYKCNYFEKIDLCRVGNGRG